MTPWPEVRRRALEVAAGRSPLLVVSDFDGTIAPISLDPLGSRIIPLARIALRRLARIAAARPDRLAVVVLSGRNAGDVAGRVRVGGLRYLGNHGLEGGWLARGGRATRDLEVSAEPGLEAFAPSAEALGDAVWQGLGAPDWLFVERKGPSVAFHYRQAPDVDAARVAVLEAIRAAEDRLGGHGLARFDGRRVVEFRPAGAGGKGAAVERLLERERPGSVLVLGDDRSDAEAFRAVHAAARELRIERVLCAAVHGAGETPEEILGAGDVVLAEPAAAARLLSLVAGALEREEPVGRGPRGAT